MKIALVYQAGIANVFRVENFGLTIAERGKTTRLLQHAFLPCEWYARGAKDAGALVRVFGCNMAGDIRDQEWSKDRGPFAENDEHPSDRHFI